MSDSQPLQHRLRSLVSGAWQVASLPAALAHELTHAAAALPWSKRVAVVFDRDGAATLQVDWTDDAPLWGIVIAHYAPLFVGALVGVAGVVHLVTAGVPTTTNNLLLAGAIAAYWVIYVAPSAADRSLPDRGDR